MPPTHKARFLGEVYPRAAFAKAQRKMISRWHTAHSHKHTAPKEISALERANEEVSGWTKQGKTTWELEGGAWMSPKEQEKKSRERNLMEALFISRLILREPLDGRSTRALLEGVKGLMLSVFLVFTSPHPTVPWPTCLLQTAKLSWHEPDHLFYQSLSSWLTADK